MSKIVAGLKNIEIKLDSSLKLDKKTITEQEEEALFKQGYYNGSIYGCVQYFIENNSLLMNCIPCNFFDLLLNTFKEKEIPRFLNVNAIIEVEDSIILIKRGEKTYNYKGYWDFPAGLVIVNQSPIEILKKRILAEIGLSADKLVISSNVFIEVLDKYLSVYYIVKSTLSKREMLSIIQNNPEGNETILLKKSEVLAFLNSKEKVFPISPLKQYLSSK